MATMAIIEYRDTQAPDIASETTEVTNWRESHMNWSLEDIRFFNMVCGYERYLARLVEL